MSSIVITLDNIDEWDDNVYPNVAEIDWRCGPLLLIRATLENFPHLESFYYNNPWGKIISLKPFSGLVNLQRLECGGNKIESLAPLSGLINLQELFCDCNIIESLAPLSGLVNLQRLECGGNRIKSLAPIRCLGNLQRLECGVAKIKSLVPISGLINLQRLECRRNKIKWLPPLSGLVNLQRLDCGENKIRSLVPISGLINLQWLECDNNKIESLLPLSTLTTLQRLECYDNNIESLAPLGTLVNLQRLYCEHNNIESLAPLSRLVNLQELYCYHNQITSLNPIIYLRRLRRILYYDNPLAPSTIQITRFLNRLRPNPQPSHNIYHDRQNIHDPYIQRTVCESVQSLLTDPAPKNVTPADIIHANLPNRTKELLIAYGQDPTPHSIHLITYQELLSYVWQRIVKSADPEELFKILANELSDAECKCFTGRFNRTLSVLVGFYDDIHINISDRSRIGAIITAVEKEIVPYDPIEHRSRARERLLELGYPEDEFEEWLEYIED